jgi:hypothetical protein
MSSVVVSPHESAEPPSAGAGFSPPAAAAGEKVGRDRREAAAAEPGFMMTRAVFLLVTTMRSTSPLAMSVLRKSRKSISRPEEDGGPYTEESRSAPAPRPMRLPMDCASDGFLGGSGPFLEPPEPLEEKENLGFVEEEEEDEDEDEEEAEEPLFFGPAEPLGKNFSKPVGGRG